MLEFLLDIDVQIFLILNGLHAPWLDKLMYLITNKYVWIPFYVFIIVLISWRFGWKGVTGLILIIVAISLADYITSGIMKPLFERFRPCHNPDISNLVHLVTHCSGKYGFASGHAANSFALASSLSLIFRKQLKYLGWIYLWALIVAYSRIYVGVHYPLDVITGALIGIIFGLLMNFIYTKLPANLKLSPGTTL
ncbi:phosphatase PAP2 family protein [Bacteroidota bacterium]